MLSNLEHDILTDIFKFFMNVDFSVYASTMGLYDFSISPKTYTGRKQEGFKCWN